MRWCCFDCCAMGYPCICTDLIQLFNYCTSGLCSQHACVTSAGQSQPEQQPHWHRPQDLPPDTSPGEESLQSGPDAPESSDGKRALHCSVTSLLSTFPKNTSNSRHCAEKKQAVFIYTTVLRQYFCYWLERYPANQESLFLNVMCPYDWMSL